MIDFGHASDELGFFRIDLLWSENREQVDQLIDQLREYTLPLNGYSLEQQIKAAKSSKTLDKVEVQWFGCVITKGSYPRRQEAYRRATK